MHSETDFCDNSFVCEGNVPNSPIHVIRALYFDVSLYLTLTIQVSSRLARSANHLWNNSVGYKNMYTRKKRHLVKPVSLYSDVNKVQNSCLDVA
jgi:hypothetical protein